MGKIYEEIDDRLAVFLTAQKMFFVATAPLSYEGHLNLSPKGTDSFRIVDSKTVAYLDLTGSGIETVAHLRENGRIVIVFCAFEGPPKIVRLHGRGEALEPDDRRFADLIGRFPARTSTRSIIRVELDRISDSCGYGIPLFRYEGERPQMGEWVERKGPEGIERYRAEYNAQSIDGLPGLHRRLKGSTRPRRLRRPRPPTSLAHSARARGGASRHRARANRRRPECRSPRVEAITQRRGPAIAESARR